MCLVTVRRSMFGSSLQGLLGELSPSYMFRLGGFIQGSMVAEQFEMAERGGHSHHKHRDFELFGIELLCVGLESVAGGETSQ